MVPAYEFRRGFCTLVRFIIVPILVKDASHPKQTERPPPIPVLFTATGTKFPSHPWVLQPLILLMESTNTPIWDNLTKTTRLGITIELLHTAEQTGLRASGGSLQLDCPVPVTEVATPEGVPWQLSHSHNCQMRDSMMSRCHSHHHQHYH